MRMRGGTLDDCGQGSPALQGPRSLSIKAASEWPVRGESTGKYADNRIQICVMYVSILDWSNAIHSLPCFALSRDWRSLLPVGLLRVAYTVYRALGARDSRLSTTSLSQHYRHNTAYHTLQQCTSCV
jgi:hypothetical protein